LNDHQFFDAVRGFLIAPFQVFSPPCDRLLGTKAGNPTFPDARHWTSLQTTFTHLQDGRWQETSMNHSIYSADRTTHLKIVVVALVAAIGVAGFSITARSTSDDGLMQTASARVLKAGKPVVITSSSNSVVR
jgi:hypothetical protein